MRIVAALILFAIEVLLFLSFVILVWLSLAHSQLAMLAGARTEGVDDHGDGDDADINDKNRDIATCEIWRILEDDGDCIREPLNKAARNEMARNHPGIAVIAIARARLTLASQQGFYKWEDFVVSWEAAFIPHHLRFTVKCSKGEVEHFASVTNRATRDPVSRGFCP